MSMQLKHYAPMLATGDMNESIAFYRDLLGFTLGDTFESSGVISWCEMKLGQATLMFTQHETQTDHPGARDMFAQTTLAFYVSNVEELYESLVNRDVEVSEMRVTFYGMKEFDLQDPTGYTLLIGESTTEAPTTQDDEAAPF